MTTEIVDPGQLTATVGQHIRGPDGANEGRLWEVLVDRAGQPRAAVIEYGGFAAFANARWRSPGGACVSRPMPSIRLR